MPAGLQVFDEEGRLVLDVTNRITRTTGPDRYKTVANTAGSVIIPDVGTGTPFFTQLTTYYYPYNSFVSVRLPEFTLTNNVLTWTAAPGVVEFIVGAY